MTMVDLNLWRLEHPEAVLEFGTHESGHPFTTQVVVGGVDLETDDVVHPLSDGLVPGRDFARGRTIEFAGVHLSTLPHPVTRRWVQPMDDSGLFEQAWRARGLRRIPGAVATLANLDRGRLVYGRPRPFVNDHARARVGWVTYACGFATIDDKFYSTTEKVVVASVDPGSTAVFTFPLTFPHSSMVPTDTRAWVDNDGTDEAWPIITFREGGHPRVTLLNDAGGDVWAAEVDATLGVGSEVVIDCRPWVRSVTRNGTAEAGLLRGSRIDEMRIPPGTHELKLVATDPTGNAEVEVRWRDAYGTL